MRCLATKRNGKPCGQTKDLNPENQRCCYHQKDKYGTISTTTQLQNDVLTQVKFDFSTNVNFDVATRIKFDVSTNVKPESFTSNISGLTITTDSTITDSIITDSNITDSTITDSNITDSNITFMPLLYFMGMCLVCLILITVSEPYLLDQLKYDWLE